MPVADGRIGVRGQLPGQVVQQAGFVGFEPCGLAPELQGFFRFSGHEQHAAQVVAHWGAIDRTPGGRQGVR